MANTMSKREPTSAEEIALGCVINLVFDKVGLASLHRLRARNKSYSGNRQLNRLIEWHQERQLVQLIDQAEEAQQNYDVQAIVLDQLRQPRFQNNAAVPKFIAGLQNNQQLIIEGNQSQTDLEDHLQFDEPNDRLSFPERTDSWIIQDGSLSSLGNTRLICRDCGNAQACMISFTVRVTQGALVINFRGNRLFCDYTAQSIKFDTPMERSTLTPCTCVPNTTYQAILSWKDDKAHLSINATNDNIQAGTATALLSCEADSGAKVAIDEVQIRRVKGLTQHKQDAQLMAQQSAVNQLGCTVLGQAFKDANTPKIELPQGTAAQSGIGISYQQRISGVSFRVIGAASDSKEKLHLGLGTLDQGQVTSPLPAMDLPGPHESPLIMRVDWSINPYTIKIERQSITTCLLENALPDTMTHFVILADRSATILSTPTKNL